MWLLKKDGGGGVKWLECCASTPARFLKQMRMDVNKIVTENYHLSKSHVLRRNHNYQSTHF